MKLNPAQPNIGRERAQKEVEAAARALGLQIQILNATSSREIDAAIAALVRELCQPALGKPAALR